MKKNFLTLSVLTLVTCALIVTGCKKETSDTTKPVMTMNGYPIMYSELGKPFPDPGASARDDKDGAVSVTTAGNVNITNPGTYQITYSSKDMAGNPASITRTVVVVQFDGWYRLKQTACTDTSKNHSDTALVNASLYPSLTGMTIQNYGLYNAFIVHPYWMGNSIYVDTTVAPSGYYISGSGTITGTGIGHDSLRLTFNFKETDTGNDTTVYTGHAQFTHR